MPYVIEPSAGVGRPLLAFLVDAYDEDVAEGEERVVLRLHPRLAPIKVAVFPLLRKGGQPEKALAIRDVLKQHFAVTYDQAGSIGRRYRRQDEIGTPVRHHRRSSDHAGRHRHGARSRHDGAGTHAGRTPGDRAARAADASRRRRRSPQRRSAAERGASSSASETRATATASSHGEEHGTSARAREGDDTPREAATVAKRRAAKPRREDAPRKPARGADAPSKYVYFFGGGKADGRADMKNLLGGKGANLAEMAGLGLPVPPGFTISTEVCTDYYAHGRSYPPALRAAGRRRTSRGSRSIVGRTLRRPDATRCSSRCARARARRCPA